MASNEQTPVIAGTPWVPASVSQLGDYELDLMKFGFFGWVNAATLVSEFWMHQCKPAVLEQQS